MIAADVIQLPAARSHLDIYRGRRVIIAAKIQFLFDSSNCPVVYFITISQIVACKVLVTILLQLHLHTLMGIIVSEGGRVSVFGDGKGPLEGGVSHRLVPLRDRRAGSRTPGDGIGLTGCIVRECPGSVAVGDVSLVVIPRRLTGKSRQTIQVVVGKVLLNVVFQILPARQVAFGGIEGVRKIW